MARNCRVNYSELDEFRKKVKSNLGSAQVDLFIESCAKELAARLLAKVVKRTPVGDYSGDPHSCVTPNGTIYHKGSKVQGKKGGTLRRGWTAGKNQAASAYAGNLKVNHYGGVYVIEIVNPVEYASYVEFGHRKRGGEGWTEGHFMLTVSEQEIQAAAPKILEAKLKKKLGEIFK